MAALSVLVRPKCGQGSWATTPAPSPLDRQLHLDVGLSGTCDPFRVRECYLPLMLSFFSPNCCTWSTIVRWRLSLSAGIATQLVTRPPARGRACLSMRTTGARQVGMSSAGSQRCLRPCIRSVLRPRCCISCCTKLTLNANTEVLSSIWP
jgi:hypothetical protein